MNTAERIFEEVRHLPEADAQEVLDFVAFLRARREQSRSEDSLLSFVGVIKDTPNFNGDLTEWQREQRREWS